MPVRFTTTILHIDMDAFYASIEQRDTPAYKGKPVIVGALPGNRGVVAAASYEARRFGVHSAMPISEAYRRCPGGVYVKPRMDAYERESGIIMEILHGFSPALEQISVDEAFLDITGTGKLWGDARAVADAIRRTITATCGLTASIGIAPNKFLAKVASDMNKPDGVTAVPFDPAAVIQWLAPLPVGKIWGVGHKTEEILARMNVRTIGDLQKTPHEVLTRQFGTNGAGLYHLCRGIDERTVQEGDSAKSISRENTFGRDTADRTVIRRALLSMSEEVARRARSEGVQGKTVVLTWRTSSFSRHTRRTTLSAPTCVARVVYDTVCSMLDAIAPSDAVRLIGVGLTGFGTGGEVQMDLFSDPHKNDRWEASERAMDRVREKLGKEKIFKGGEQKKTGEND